MTYDEFNRREGLAMIAFEAAADRDNWLPFCVPQPSRGSVTATYRCECGFQTTSRREIWNHCQASHEKVVEL